MSLMRQIATLLQNEQNPAGLLSRVYLASERLPEIRERWEATPARLKARLIVDGLKSTLRTGTRDNKP